MDIVLLFVSLFALVVTGQQLPTPSSAPPPLPMPPSETALPIPTLSVPLPPPLPATFTTVTQNPQPPAPAPGGGETPTCECGFTYCASVLMAMPIPWNVQQLAQEYCATPNADCPNGAPATDVAQSLYLCLCDGPNKKRGDVLNLLCGCDKCLNIGPDYRGRCETPCLSRGG